MYFPWDYWFWLTSMLRKAKIFGLEPFSGVNFKFCVHKIALQNAQNNYTVVFGRLDLFKFPLTFEKYEVGCYLRHSRELVSCFSFYKTVQRLNCSSFWSFGCDLKLYSFFLFHQFLFIKNASNKAIHFGYFKDKHIRLQFLRRRIW